MIDIKQFRKANKLTQGDVANYLGISVAFLSAAETGRANFPDKYADLLINNNRGWIFDSSIMVADEPLASQKTSTDWPAIVADLSAKIGEQNNQISRLLTIVEQLTSAEKK